GLLIFASSMKLFGLIPPDQVEKMAEHGLAGKLILIGTGELITAILLIIPLTMSLGVLLASGFWGGVICFHLTHNEDIFIGSIMLLLTWLGAFLRDKRQLASFLPAASATDSAQESGS